jgi:hypothetical protein
VPGAAVNMADAPARMDYWQKPRHGAFGQQETFEAGL